MKRAARRRARRNRGTAAVPELARRFADRYACPDCTAVTHLTELDDGVLVLDVLHDDTGFSPAPGCDVRC
jgi:hypothetical protein